MKTKKLNKKLSLNKKTISILNNEQMSKAQGGDFSDPTYCLTICMTVCVSLCPKCMETVITCPLTADC